MPVSQTHPAMNLLNTFEVPLTEKLRGVEHYHVAHLLNVLPALLFGESKFYTNRGWSSYKIERDVLNHTCSISYDGTASF